jgi:hypothetical protein
MYRIKIEEHNNEEKRYIPQVGTTKLRTGRVVWLGTKWENIITQHNRYIVSNGMTESYNTEQEALNVIEGFKKNILEEDGKKVKSTTYKMID